MTADNASAKSERITLWNPDTPVVTAPGDQGLQLAIATDGAGGAFVVWEDRRLALVFAQRIDASGNRLWGSAKQVAFTEWQKFEPAIVEDGSGGAIVAWTEGRSGFCGAGFKADCDVYAQRFSQHGERLWGKSGVPVSLAPANQGVSGISMTSDKNGGAFLVWEDARPDCCKVYAQHILADGSPAWEIDGLRLSPEPTIVFGPMFGPPQIVSDGSGGAIVVWLENQVDPEIGPPPVTVQRIDANGDILWTENGVPVGLPVFVSFSVAGDGAGGAFVAFVADTDADFGEMSVQRVAPNGTPLWGENGALLGEPDYYAETPDLIADGNGGAIVTWVNHAFDQVSASESIDIFAQRLDAVGMPTWDSGGQPLCTLPGEQDDPRIIGDGAGGAIVVWRDCRNHPDRIDCFFGSDIYAQHVRADGTEKWPAGGTPVSAATGPQSVGQGTPPRHFIHLAPDTAGGAIVAWPDGRRSGCENAIFTTECDVFAQRINSAPPVQKFAINPGLNDAWYSVATRGQGFFIIVFPSTGQIFLAWFTFDTERPDAAVKAMLGEPGHRWLTAQGPYAGDTANLTVYLTEGGVFDSAMPRPNAAKPVGTMTVIWKDCESATLTYDINPPGVQGQIELTRIVPDNVALCEALSEQ